MLLKHCRWHPQLTADLNLDQDDIKTMANELVSFHRCFHDAYGSIEHHRLGLAYLSGLMSNAEAKSVEPIALEFLDKKSVRSMQMFMKNFRWDHMSMLRIHRNMLAPLTAAPDGMITVDPSDFVKKGKESVGVAQQYCGADTAFGGDIDFLNALPKDLSYFATIKSDTQVFTKKPRIGLPPYKGRGRRPSQTQILPGQPKPKRVSEIAKSGRLSWKAVVVAEGAKGPIIAKVARIRVYLSRDGLPVGDRQWLFFRKNNDGEIKYAISNAPKEISLSELVKASTMRWPIEQCFQEGKGQVGMDCYEHRSWPAWHRHMTYVFLALHFMLRMRLRFEKNASVDDSLGPQNTIVSTSPEIAECSGGDGNSSISPSPEFGRL